MKMHVAISAALALAALPAVALSQVTQAYQYDGNGRLTGVTTTGSAGTNTATYAYDDAHNRTGRTQTGTVAWAAVPELPVNQFLRPDEALVSPDGHYSFALRPSGEMELWLDGGKAASGARPLAASFRLTGGGEAKFLPASLVLAPTTGAWISLRDDGALSVVDEAGNEVWRSAAAIGPEVGQ
jgi:glucose/arabinose dehydrogenase